MIFLKTMMVICFGIFSFGFLYYTRKFIFKNIALVVDEKGITNNSSIISLGFIPWEDIQEIKFTNILNSKLILVKVYDEEKYLVGISKFKKLMININKKFGYPIHCITLNTTGSKPEEINKKNNSS